MTGNYDITWEETVDPAGINCGPEGYLVSAQTNLGGATTFGITTLNIMTLSIKIKCDTQNYDT